MKRKLNKNPKSLTSKILTNSSRKAQPKIKSKSHFPIFNISNININNKNNQKSKNIPYRLLFKSLIKYLKKKLPIKLFDEVVNFVQTQIVKYNKMNNSFILNNNYKRKAENSKKSNNTISIRDNDSCSNTNTFINNTIDNIKDQNKMKNYYLIDDSLYKKTKNNLKISIDFDSNRNVQNNREIKPKIRLDKIDTRPRKITNISILLNNSNFHIPNINNNNFYKKSAKLKNFSTKNKSLNQKNKPNSVSKTRNIILNNSKEDKILIGNNIYKTTNKNILKNKGINSQKKLQSDLNDTKLNSKQFFANGNKKITIKTNILNDNAKSIKINKIKPLFKMKLLNKLIDKKIPIIDSHNIILKASQNNCNYFVEKYLFKHQMEANKTMKENTNQNLKYRLYSKGQLINNIDTTNSEIKKIVFKEKSEKEANSASSHQKYKSVNEEIIRNIKNNLDDSLKMMLNFSYGDFLSKESEQDSKNVSQEYGINNTEDGYSNNYGV